MLRICTISKIWSLLTFTRFTERTKGKNMPKTGIRHIHALVIILITAILAGCATTGDQRVDILYQRIVYTERGTGDLYLAQESSVPSTGTTPIQWIIGEITNNDGEKLGNIVTDVAPTDLLMEAFIQEFKGSGYNVFRESPIPQGATKGLKLKSVTIKLEEVKSVPKATAKCKVKISIEPWLNGKAVNKLEYEAEYEDTAITDRDELLSKAMLQAIQTLMARSVPEIIKTLEQK